MRYFPKILFASLLLAGSAIYLNGNLRLVVAVLSCIALFISLVVFRRHNRLGENLSIVSVALMGYTLLYAFSCLWGPFGSESLPNATSLIIGTTIYILLLAFSREKMTDKLPGVFCGGSGIVALLSLDASSAQVLTPYILMPILQSTGGPGFEEMQYEEAMRIVGVVGGANVLAGLLGIATLLSLYLFLNTDGRSRGISAVVLMLNSTVFLLAFSMGAFCAFAIGLGVYLLFANPGERSPLFLLMSLTLLISLPCVALMTLGLGRYGTAASFFTLFCPFAFAVLLSFVFPFILAGLEALKKKGQRNVLAKVVGGIVIIAMLYVFLASSLSVPITLTPWEKERDAYLPAGDYVLNLISDNPVNILIASQSREELLDGNYNYLYDGRAAQANFTVPENAGIVRFGFTGKDKLYSAAYHGVRNGELTMELPLVPNFVENRMRGMFFSKNIYQRIEMCQDGLKLFASSPLLGRGAGAFEAKAYSVQQHYYETKYVHNQYIQSMVDTGVLGLAFFILILGAAFLQVYRRKDMNSALAPSLMACLIMAGAHGFTEVVWSMHSYVLFLFVLIAICGLAFPAPLKSMGTKKWAPRVYITAVLVFSLAVTIHLYVQREYQYPSEKGLTPERIAFFSEIEPFSKEVYQLDYVCNYGGDALKSKEYIANLRSRKSYEINMLLLQYLYLPTQDEENIKIVAREAYWDRRHDKEAVKDLYNLLVAHNAEELFTEGKN